MTDRRRAPNMTEKLAAALLTIVRPDDTGKLVRVISHAEAKRMSPKAILARFEFNHHPVRVADQAALSAAGIPYINHPSNLDPLPKPEHRKVTADVDIPEIARGKRIVKKRALTLTHGRHSAEAGIVIDDLKRPDIARSFDPERDLVPKADRQPRKFKWPSRPLRSRNNFGRRP